MSRPDPDGDGARGGLPAADSRPALRAALAYFLDAWSLELGRSALRALEAVAFGDLPPLTGRVLDLGCGDGAFGRWVIAADRVYGVDTDVGRLRAAAGRGVLAVAADAARLPFPPGSFDAVIANSTLEHLTDPGAAVRSAAGVLRPGGRFVCTVPLEAVLDNLFFAAGADAARYRQWFTDYWQHRTMRSADGWVELVRRCAPGLAPVYRRPLESPRQTELVDLLWSLRLTPAALIGADPSLRDAQRRGLADLLAGVLTDAAAGPEGRVKSAVILEFVARAPAR